MSSLPRLYADSADVDAVSPLLRDSLVHGVTTNPTILERAGRTVEDIASLYARWIDDGAHEIFFQAWGTDAAALLASAARITALGDRVVVKVPATRDGFAAASALTSSGVSVLLTAVYSEAQALVAASIGVRYIAPYLGRLRDSGLDGLKEIGRMQALVTGSATDVLAASIRTPADLVDLALAGVRHCTAAPAVITAAMQNDTSDAAAVEFDAAALRGAVVPT